MLEIFILKGMQRDDINTLLAWLSALDVPCTVENAPKEPAIALSAWTETAHKQVGIYHEPIKKGHLRMLLANEKGVGPHTGECVKNRIFVGTSDPQELGIVALHELGHALKVVSSGRPKLLKMTYKPEFAAEAREEKMDLVKKLSKENPDGVIDFGGLHCLTPGCVMLPWIPSGLEHRSVHEFFCSNCSLRFQKNLDKLVEEAEHADKACATCQGFKRCMYTKGIWEETAVCDDYETTESGPPLVEEVAPVRIKTAP